MKYCKKCGKSLGENDIFCSNCGEKITNDAVHSDNDISTSNNNNNIIFPESNNNYTNTKENNFHDEIRLTNNNQTAQNIVVQNDDITPNENNTMVNVKKDKEQRFGDIVRYSFGGFLVLGNIIDLPKLSGIIGIIAGLCMMPVIIKLLKEKLKIYFKGISVVLPIIFIIFWVSCLPTEESEMQNESVENHTNEQIKTEDKEDNKEEISKIENLQKKWKDYYNKENIEIIETNQNTLYEYGKYYSGLTVLTSVVIEQKNSTSIKTKIKGQENSGYYSFIFNFEDKKELSYYKKGDTVIIVGTVSESTKEITLKNCHIISSGSSALEKTQELQKQSEQHNNYAKALKSELSKKGKIGDGYIEILDAKVINGHGDKILIVSLLYKNEADENKEFNYTANAKVFQNGIELQSSIMKCSWYNEKYKDNADVELQPGVSVTVNKCFLIEDTSSDVEVVVESWMFANLHDTLFSTFKLK